MIRVWDPFVRAFHWALALSFALAWASAEHSEGLHEGAGWVVCALVLARITWGFVGSDYARFSQFVRSPEAIIAYLRAMTRRLEPRFIGHNPAGGAMVVTLLFAIACTVATGFCSAARF
jgi:cytochrome b